MTKPPATAEEERMETYTALRHFADSWGLLGMTLFFIGAVIRVPSRQPRQSR